MTEYHARDLTHHQVLQRNRETNTATVITSQERVVHYKTGGPYVIDGKEGIYVGDIWVMAGQSNMRGHGYLNTAFQKNEPQVILDHVHLYDSTERWRVSSDPSHELALSKRTVHKVTPDPTVRNPTLTRFRGASIALGFGSNYEKGVPVGLIASAHGGVTLRQWSRPEVLDEDSFDKTLYGAMIDRIRKVGGQIAGILWYQGESDTLLFDDAVTYSERFSEWLKVLREDMKNPTLPVVIVQIGPHRLADPNMIKNWMIVQDQQTLLVQTKDQCTALVSSIDCSLDDKLHLSREGLNTLGRRLAKAAILAMNKQSHQSLPRLAHATYEKVIHISGVSEVHTILLDFDIPPTSDFKFNSGGADVAGFTLESKTNAEITRACIEENKTSIRLYLTSNPFMENDVFETACFSYGMNQKYLNLNCGEDRVLPAFSGLCSTS